jgi:hypothetical protein
VLDTIHLPTEGFHTLRDIYLADIKDTLECQPAFARECRLFGPNCSNNSDGLDDVWHAPLDDKGYAPSDGTPPGFSAAPRMLDVHFRWTRDLCMNHALGNMVVDSRPGEPATTGHVKSSKIVIHDDRGTRVMEPGTFVIGPKIKW